MKMEAFFFPLHATVCWNTGGCVNRLKTPWKKQTQWFANLRLCKDQFLVPYCFVYICPSLVKLLLLMIWIIIVMLMTFSCIFVMPDDSTYSLNSITHCLWSRTVEQKLSHKWKQDNLFSKLESLATQSKRGVKPWVSFLFNPHMLYGTQNALYHLRNITRKLEDAKRITLLLCFVAWGAL